MLCNIVELCYFSQSIRVAYQKEILDHEHHVQEANLQRSDVVENGFSYCNTSQKKQ